MRLHEGHLIDEKYRIVRLLGEGSVGEVYLAENVRIGRHVALKLLHTDVASEAEARARFRAEAQLTARAGSPHIVDILDLGDLPGGSCYLVMEYLEGETLTALIAREGILSAATTSSVAAQVLEALSAAHGANVVHRDIKPDNIFLVPQEGGLFVKLLDFGVSKLLSDAKQRDPHLTMDGTIVGTPEYMSPEQARGLELDGRSDLFSLGVVMYECLSGETPFSGDGAQEILLHVALEEAPRLDAGILGIDPSFVRIVETAMERSPRARYQTAAAFREALLTWAQVMAAAHTEAAGTAAHLSAPPVAFAAEDPADTPIQTYGRKYGPPAAAALLVAAAASLFAVSATRGHAAVVSPTQPGSVVAAAPQEPAADTSPASASPAPDGSPVPVPSSSVAPSVGRSTARTSRPTNASTVRSKGETKAIRLQDASRPKAAPVPQAKALPPPKTPPAVSPPQPAQRRATIKGSKPSGPAR